MLVYLALCRDPSESLQPWFPVETNSGSETDSESVFGMLANSTDDHSGTVLYSLYNVLTIMQEANRDAKLNSDSESPTRYLQKLGIARDSFRDSLVKKQIISTGMNGFDSQLVCIRKLII